MTTELGYLGDGVYLSHDGWQFWLAVNNHENKVVALEPDVVLGFVRAVMKHAPAFAVAIRAAAQLEIDLCNLEVNLDDNPVQRDDEGSDGDSDS